MNSDHVIHGCSLIMTSFACPEQYDVYKGETQIGYLRLRHGNFSAEYPDCGGEMVYEAQPKGDGLFEEDERNKYLGEAVEALLRVHKALAAERKL